MENLRQTLVDASVDPPIADLCARLYTRTCELADELEPEARELQVARLEAVFSRLVAIAGNAWYGKLLAKCLDTDTPSELGPFFVMLIRCLCDRQLEVSRLAPDGEAFGNWNEMTSWKRRTAAALS